MALALFSATTRVVRTVRTVRRADSRATTEPRPARNVTEHDSTTPYHRQAERDVLVAESAKAPRDSLPYCEIEIATQELVTDLTTAPAADPVTGAMTWIGVTLSDPQIGAAIVIGTWLRPEFRVTSPVTHVFPCQDGVLVQTSTKSRYFVEPGGDVYLVRRVG
ncbi:MAG TPA: hypothetical protein VFS15_20780 [Kofleriaceae bacterium]|nr:hypothetical protein [Kofleriaceae bacterium]